MAKMAESPLGLNATQSIDGDILTLKIDLSKDSGPSSTGKSRTIGTTSGNQTLVHNGQIVKVGVNVYIPNK